MSHPMTLSQLVAIAPPSDYPDFAAFLVREGIDSISLNPDSILKITLRVLEMEKEIGKAR